MSDPWAFGWTQLLAIIGFIITVAIAIGGFRTCDRWKREKLEEKRIDTAIEALALVYESKFIFDRIRKSHVRPPLSHGRRHWSALGRDVSGLCSGRAVCNWRPTDQRPGLRAEAPR